MFFCEPKADSKDEKFEDEMVWCRINGSTLELEDPESQRTDLGEKVYRFGAVRSMLLEHIGFLKNHWTQSTRKDSIPTV